MARKLFGTSIALPAPFVAGSCDPVDARLVVESFEDLTTNAADTFGTIGSDYCKVYSGIQVYVTGEKATYMFVGESDANGVLLTSVQSSDSWRKLSADGMSTDDIQDEIEKITVKNTDGSISVAEAADGTTISVKLDNTDKVLTISSGGVKTNVSLKWDKVTGLQLIGKNSTVITTIPATDFIKDGMLDKVTLETDPSGQPKGTYLHFVFNADSGKSDIYLNVTNLIDIYTGGNGVDVDGSNVISAVIDPAGESYLSVGASGIKLEGVDAAIEAKGQSLQSAVDTVEASVGLNSDGSHVKTSGNYTSGATTVVGEISALDTQVKKNADAIAAETSRATGVETNIQAELDKVEAAAGIQNDGTYAAPSGTNYLGSATSLMDADKKLDAQVKVNADAISAEVTRAKAEEARITDTVIGEDQLEEGKSVMDVILENEETTQQAIEQLATAAGVLSGEQIKYTAPTVSGEFSSTTSIMDMLNVIDKKWNTIDCGTY